MLKCENESDGSIESMNGSWVKLEPTQSQNNSPKLSDGEEMETLLADAADEQRRFSRSQANEENTKESVLMKGKSDWVEAWASRPEQHPPQKFKMEHPPHAKSSALSIRRTKVMKSADLFTTNLMIIIPILAVSHAVTFGIGIYIGKKFNVSVTSK